MKMKLLATGCLLLCTIVNINAQSKAYEFKKIKPEDFSLTGITVDTSYGAVVLADVGKSSFEGNSKGWFTLVYKHQRRVRIINKNGFDIATVAIPLYHSIKSDDEEKLDAVKATTYNLVDGKVVETDLNKGDIFKEVQDRSHTLRKFTLPAVKEGSIIEYSYTIKSDFLFNLQPWSFQGSYPRMWSEYELNLPQFFQYVFLSQGKKDFFIKDSKEKFQNFTVRQTTRGEYGSGSNREDVFNLSSTNTISRWVMKEIPAIRQESFTSTIENYIARIQFQMSGQQFPDMPFKDIMGSWPQLSLELLRDKDFGAEITSANTWLDETMTGFKLDTKDSMQRVRTVYNYVQQQFSSLGMKGIYISQPVKETFKLKKGYESDINMLLTLMLMRAGYKADPVILSTKAHGFPTETYPLIHQYNYLITKVFIGDKAYYLDASDRSLGFGKLPQFCYNGIGVSINLSPGMEPLYADNLKEAKVTNIVLMNDEKNKNAWSGNLSSYLGYYESVDIRDEIAEKGKDAYSNKLKESYTGDYAISDVNLESLDNKDEVVLMKYNMKVDRGDDVNLIYFNPMIKEGIKENYFKSSERNYPVEMPFQMDETLVLKIQVPDGFEIDEIPKSTKVTLNGSEGLFEYIVSKTPTEVSLRTKLAIYKTLFMPDEYEALKNFYDYVVKKHAEQIVFKKK